MLTVPFAISEGGWTAVMLLAILGVVTNYTGTVYMNEFLTGTFSY